MGIGVVIATLFCLCRYVLAFEEKQFTSLAGCEQGYTLSLPSLNSIPVRSEIECGVECGHTNGCFALSVCPTEEDPGQFKCSLFPSVSDGTCGSLSSVTGCKYKEIKHDCPESMKYDVTQEKCVCRNIWVTGNNCESYYRDCTEAVADGFTDTNEFFVMEIKPDVSTQPFEVRCYLQWGGWTQVMQRNIKCPLDIRNLNWLVYREGFGNFTCEFFLGLEKMYQILQNGAFTLDVFVIGEDGLYGHAYYKNLRLGDESTQYAMSWDSYEPNVGEPANDGFSFNGRSLQGAKFGTHDNLDPANCAASEGTGWWYGNNCPYVNLHMPLNTSALGTVGSASWPKDGVLKNLNYFLFQLQRTG